MRKISEKELEIILKEHKLWLNGEGGKQANLREVDLEGADLEGTDLYRANLCGVNLREANLENTDLRGTDLYGADLRGADLRKLYLSETNLCRVDLCRANLYGANLEGADLCRANLRRVDLHGANLCGANLCRANLRGANLRGANLYKANLTDVKTDMCTIGFNLACPEEGSFIGYKKANNCIIKLLIPEDAKRSSATTMKCRCDKAKVLDIEDIESGMKIKKVNSNYNKNFVYEVGEIVEVDYFNENRWIECTSGIHFFMNRQNALDY